MVLPMRTKRNTRKRQATTELLQKHMAVLKGIARGEMAVAEGRVVSHTKAKTRMARWLK